MDLLEHGDPDFIGGYEVIGRLGAGAMGVVYKAWNEAGVPVAIKVISSRFVRDEKYRQRFLTEASVAQKIPKFCTAQVLDSSLSGDQPYIVTEYVPGPTLLTEVVGRPLGGSELDSLAVGIVAALNAIHNAGVVHRDLKPANILLSPYGPRVIDFGLASIVEAARITSAGNAVGTISFMAPEQAGGRSADPKADIYSWAATMVFAATGRPPAGPIDNHGLINDHDSDVVGVSGVLHAMVVKALNREPSERPTAAEILAALASLAPGVLASAVDHDVRPRPGTTPRTADQWAAKARDNLASGRFRLALFDAEQGISVNPSHAKCWLQKGIAQVQLGLVEQGEDSMRLAYEMDGLDPEISSRYSSTLAMSPNKKSRSLGFSIAPALPAVRRAFIEFVTTEDDDAVWAEAVRTTGDPEIVWMYSKRVVGKIVEAEEKLAQAKRRAELSRLALASIQAEGAMRTRRGLEAREVARKEQETSEDAARSLHDTATKAYLVLPMDFEVRRAYGRHLIREGAQAVDIGRGFELAGEAPEIFDELVLRFLDDPDPELTREVLSQVTLKDSEILLLAAALHDIGKRPGVARSRWSMFPVELTYRALNIELLVDLCLTRIASMRDQDVSGELLNGLKSVRQRAFSASDDNFVADRASIAAAVFGSGFLAGCLIYLVFFLLSTPSSPIWLLALLPAAALAAGVRVVCSEDKVRLRRRARLLDRTAVRRAGRAGEGGRSVGRIARITDAPVSDGSVVQAVVGEVTECREHGAGVGGDSAGPRDVSVPGAAVRPRGGELIHTVDRQPAPFGSRPGGAPPGTYVVEGDPGYGRRA